MADDWEISQSRESQFRTSHVHASSIVEFLVTFDEAHELGTVAVERGLDHDVSIRSTRPRERALVFPVVKRVDAGRLGAEPIAELRTN